jgi:hypothetical protein
MEFLQAALVGGPVPAAELSRMAHERGLTPKAIRMGRESLAVEIERNGFGPGGQSLWSLPGKFREDCRGQASDEVSASREEPNVSEAQPTIDGYEILGPS